MQNVAPKDIRTFALVGHHGSGKTRLAEAMLVLAGVKGSVNEASLLDFEPEEQAHSISAAVASFHHQGRRLHVVDTPGDGSFIHEARAALGGVDAAVCVISAVDGVEVETERTWRIATDLGLARLIVLNKMDRDRADPERVLAEIEATLGVKPVPVEVPIGREGAFRGVVDLLRHEARLFRADGSGQVDTGPVPPEVADAVALGAERLAEAAAETDDELLEAYLESLELSPEQVERGLAEGVRDGKIVPVIFTDASTNRGVHRLLELTAMLPSPLDRPPRECADGDRIAPDPAGPFVGQVIKSIIDPYAGRISLVRVFRGSLTADTELENSERRAPERVGSLAFATGKKLTDAGRVTVGDIVAMTKLKDTHTGDTLCDPRAHVALLPLAFRPPMSTVIVKPATRKDEDRMRDALAKLHEEDPALVIGSDGLTKEITLSGQSSQHIESALQRMARKYKVNVTTEIPPVPYRETIKGTADVEGKHKKQTGGRGQFAVAFLKVEPLPRDGGFEFIDAIKGGAIPRNYIPAVEKGIRGAMERGVLAGYPVQDVRVTVHDGKFHSVDSSEAAFMLAGSKGFKAGFLQARPTLLEPLVRMTIVCPDDTVGDVMGDIGSRRGRLQNTEYRGSRAIVYALVPQAEVQTYGTDLLAMTQGKGSFTFEHAGYEELPSHLVEKVIAEGRGVASDDDDE